VVPPAGEKSIQVLFKSGGAVVERWTCDQQVVGSIPIGRKLRNNLGQVVHTYVPLSQSSVTWYQSKDGDALWRGR